MVFLLSREQPQHASRAESKPDSPEKEQRKPPTMQESRQPALNQFHCLFAPLQLAWVLKQRQVALRHPVPVLAGQVPRRAQLAGRAGRAAGAHRKVVPQHEVWVALALPCSTCRWRGGCEHRMAQAPAASCNCKASLLRRVELRTTHHWPPSRRSAHARLGSPLGAPPSTPATTVLAQLRRVTCKLPAYWAPKVAAQPADNQSAS